MTKEDQILEILQEHTKKFDAFQGQFNSLEGTVTNINETVIVLENEFKDKTSALFDGHTIHQEHLEKNDRNFEDVQAILENHSVRLISLEIDSKERI